MPIQFTCECGIPKEKAEITEVPSLAGPKHYCGDCIATVVAYQNDEGELRQRTAASFSEARANLRAEHEAKMKGAKLP